MINIALNGENKEFLHYDKLERFYHNSGYCNRKYSFDQDYATDYGWQGIIGNHYIPYSERKPKFQSSIARNIVDVAVSQLWGEEHFPLVTVSNANEGKEAQNFLDWFINDSFIKQHVLECSKMALIMGKALLAFKVIEGKFYLEVINYKYVYDIVFDKRIPNKILSVRIRYKKPIFDKVENKIKWYWYQTDYNETQEIVYKMQEVKDYEVPKFTVDETYEHNFGFIPLVLFKTSDEKGIFEEQIDNIKAVDEYSSVIYLGSRNSMNPQFVGFGLDADILSRDTGNIWNFSNPDAKLESIAPSMSGYKEALQQYKDMVENIYTSCRIIHFTNVKEEESGVSRKIRYAPQLYLIEELRICFGEQSLRDLIKKMYIAGTMCQLDLDDDIIQPKDNKIKINLKWQPLISQTIQEKQMSQQIIINAIKNGLLDLETAVIQSCQLMDIDDTMDIIEKLKIKEQENESGISEQPVTPDSINRSNAGKYSGDSRSRSNQANNAKEVGNTAKGATE